MMNKRGLVFVALLVVAAFLLQGCASSPAWRSVPAYPAQGQTSTQVARDQSDCEAWARQETGYDPAADTVSGGAVGALIGAAIGAAAGAAIGAAAGDPGTGAAIGAAVGGTAGAVTGGSRAYANSREGYEKAYAVCMAARGYTVSGAAAPAPARVLVPAQPVSVPSNPPICVGKMEQEYGWQQNPGGWMMWVPTGRKTCNGVPF